MSEPLLLAYVFTTFVIGMACAGAVTALMRIRKDALARLFLFLYVPLSALVLGALLLAFIEMQPAVSPLARAALEYGEGFVGRYGVMLALPLFAHRVFGVHNRRLDAALAAIVITTFAAQHVTEFVLAGSPWDARGDLTEDLVFAGVIGYTLLVAIRRLEESVHAPLARRFLLLLLVGLPGTLFDLFIADGPGLRLYPLWYCALGVTMMVSLCTRPPAVFCAIPTQWELTEREEEVLGLVRQGLSNAEIAQRLKISPNTVKTHLRAIFDKSGLRSRVALIAQSQHHPAG